MLITSSGVDGFNGTEASILGGFAKIDEVTAPVVTLNTLQQGENLDNLWTVTTANSGTLNTAGNNLNLTTSVRSSAAAASMVSISPPG